MWDPSPSRVPSQKHREKLLFLSSPTWHEAIRCCYSLHSHIPAGAPGALPECAEHAHTPAHTPLHTPLARDLPLSRPAAYILPLLSTLAVTPQHTHAHPHRWPALASAHHHMATAPASFLAWVTHTIVGSHSLPSHNSSGPSMKTGRGWGWGGLRIRDGPGLPMALPAPPLKTASCPRPWPLTQNCSGLRPHADQTAQAEGDSWETGLSLPHLPLARLWGLR